jgi:hypothetical protein
MNIYNYYSQSNNNVNLFIYIALHVSTSNRSSSGAASFLHTVTKLQHNNSQFYIWFLQISFYPIHN